MRHALAAIVVASCVLIPPLGASAHGISAGYSYGSTVSPSGTVYVTEPTVWVLIEPDPGSPAPTVTLTLDGTAYPMSYDPALDVALYTFPTPLAPGSQWTGTVTISEGGYRTATLPVAFTIASQPAGPLAQTLSGWQALAEVNAIRQTEGVGVLVYDPALAAAAMAHAKYYVNNQDLYASGTLSLHQEVPGTPGFTGIDPWNRDEAFAASEPTTGEVMAVGEGSDMGALLALFDTTFHRFGLLSGDYSAFGSGYSPAVSGQDAFVADMGGPDIAPQGTSGVMLFPWNGAQGVPTGFWGEDPNPLAAYRSNLALASDPAGYPVSLTFTGAQVTGVSVSSASLTGPSGAAVPIWVVDSQDYTDQNNLYPGETMGNSVALFGKSALDPGTTYHVQVTGTLSLANGTTNPFTEDWSFATRPSPTVSKAFIVGSSLYLEGRNLGQAQVTTPVAATSSSSAYTYAERTFARAPTFTRIRVAGAQVALTAPPFTDLSQATWATPYVIRAQAEGVVEGEGHGIYAPNAPLTGLEALTMIYRSLGQPSVPLAASLSGVPGWAGAAVTWALSDGLVTRSDVPSLAEPAQRADLARWLLAANGIPGSGTAQFTDASEIPSQDMGFVAEAQSLGVITGFPDGSFRPLGSITRAQMAKVLSLMMLPRHL